MKCNLQWNLKWIIILIYYSVGQAPKHRYVLYFKSKENKFNIIYLTELLAFVIRKIIRKNNCCPSTESTSVIADLNT